MASHADLLQFIFAGLTNGAIYALIALGFGVVHNTMGIVNFVQVDFVSLGGMLLYSALFTRCEQEYGVGAYAKILAALLQHLSTAYVQQRVLVTGHISVRNGYQIIAGQHLRLASSAHARPREAGRYLLFDTTRPISKASDLRPNLHTVYAA